MRFFLLSLLLSPSLRCVFLFQYRNSSKPLPSTKVHQPNILNIIHIYVFLLRFPHTGNRRIKGKCNADYTIRRGWSSTRRLKRLTQDLKSSATHLSRPSPYLKIVNIEWTARFIASLAIFQNWEFSTFRQNFECTCTGTSVALESRSISSSYLILRYSKIPKRMRRWCLASHS